MKIVEMKILSLFIFQIASLIGLIITGKGEYFVVLMACLVGMYILGEIKDYK